MFEQKRNLDPGPRGSGFQSLPPMSRPPTKVYDRDSNVLVVDESDEVLRFVKIHLNRYFSHVHAARSVADALAHLKHKTIQVIIADAAPAKKSNADFLKKIAAHWRQVPVVLTEAEDHADVNVGQFPHVVVVDVVRKPFDLDSFHIAIRRSIAIAKSLRQLSDTLPAKAPIGETVRTAPEAELADSVKPLVVDIRKKLTEDIVD
ncbi:MAG: response regulator [Proteobacteria bacterium]|nr:response regulator [Pseudomonadota bacterium]